MDAPGPPRRDPDTLRAGMLKLGDHLSLVAAGEGVEDDDEEEIGNAYWHDRYFQYR